MCNWFYLQISSLNPRVRTDRHLHSISCQPIFTSTNADQPWQQDDIITEHISYLYLLSDVLSMCWLILEKIKGITLFWRNGKIETWLLGRKRICLFKDVLPYMSNPSTWGDTAELYPGTWLKKRQSFFLIK